MTQHVTKNHVHLAHMALRPHVHVIPVLWRLIIAGRDFLCVCLGESFRDLRAVAGIVRVGVGYPSGDEIFGEAGKFRVVFGATGGALDFGWHGIEWAIELAVILEQRRTALPFDEIGVISEPDKHVKAPSRGLKVSQIRGTAAESVVK